MLAERLLADEEMDDPALDAATYHEVLKDLGRVNRMTLAYRPTLAFLSRIAKRQNAIRILDVGFGQGDTLRAIAKWAEQSGVTAQLVGIDLNPRSEAAARAATPAGMAIDYRTGDYADLTGEHFDCIISSLVAHHMDTAELLAFLRFMDSEARSGWFINDLHRHGLSYSGYPLLARLMGTHPIVRRDGHKSIARSYRPAEWHDLLRSAGISGAIAERYFPFRLCVEKIH